MTYKLVWKILFLLSILPRKPPKEQIVADFPHKEKEIMEKEIVESGTVNLHTTNASCCI